MKIVRTYATSANLGPGFDCLGICFDIYNEYTFEKSDKFELLGFDKAFLNPKNTGYLAAGSMLITATRYVSSSKPIKKSHKFWGLLTSILTLLHIGLVEYLNHKYKKM
jgi:homoserine kinase